MPKFNSNVNLVTMKGNKILNIILQSINLNFLCFLGLGLFQILLKAKNIFTVDASAAGKYQ